MGLPDFVLNLLGTETLERIIKIMPPLRQLRVDEALAHRHVLHLLRIQLRGDCFQHGIVLHMERIELHTLGGIEREHQLFLWIAECPSLKPCISFQTTSIHDSFLRFFPARRKIKAKGDGADETQT